MPTVTTRKVMLKNRKKIQKKNFKKNFNSAIVPFTMPVPSLVNEEGSFIVQC